MGLILLSLLSFMLIPAMVEPNATMQVPTPYCDQVTDEYMIAGGICHDRYDFSDITSLATCRNGTHTPNPLECK